MTIERLTVSMCKSADWCAGYNAAVEKIEELIEADVEYDKARRLVEGGEWADHHAEFAAREHLGAASRERSAALAALRGETP